MRLLPLLIALPLVVAYGIAEGRFTNRWSSSDEIEQAAARLAGIPATIGDWLGSDEELDARQIARAEIAGYVQRRYVHQRTGAVLGVLLVCGRPGPTSLHTPEICFPATGYAQAATPERIAIPGLAAPAEFWGSRYQLSGDTVEPIHVYWSWNAADQWVAADYARFQFGRYPFLYKLYVTRPLARADEANAADISAEFLVEFLPQARKALFGTPSAQP